MIHSQPACAHCNAATLHVPGKIMAAIFMAAIFRALEVVSAAHA
jgi:hypothetical protein